MLPDLETARPGTYTFPVELIICNLPVSLNIERIAPNRVELVIEQLIEKELLCKLATATTGSRLSLEQIEIVPQLPKLWPKTFAGSTISIDDQRLI